MVQLVQKAMALSSSRRNLKEASPRKSAAKAALLGLTRINYLCQSTHAEEN